MGNAQATPPRGRANVKRRSSGLELANMQASSVPPSAAGSGKPTQQQMFGGSSALHTAAAQTTSDSLVFLLDMAAWKEVDVPDFLGRTALFFAIEGRNQENLRLLIKANSSVFSAASLWKRRYSYQLNKATEAQFDRHGKPLYVPSSNVTPLLFATSQRNHYAMEQVLSRANDGSSRSPFLEADEYKVTALHVAAFHHDVDAVKLILAALSDEKRRGTLQSQTRCDGTSLHSASLQTPLHCVVESLSPDTDEHSQYHQQRPEDDVDSTGGDDSSDDLVGAGQANGSLGVIELFSVSALEAATVLVEAAMQDTESGGGFVCRNSVTVDGSGHGPYRYTPSQYLAFLLGIYGVESLKVLDMNTKRLFKALASIETRKNDHLLADAEVARAIESALGDGADVRRKRASLADSSSNLYDVI